MLHNYFTSQQQHTIKTNERLKKLNDIANRNIKQPNNFHTNYTRFQNTFFNHLEKLREEKPLVENDRISVRKDIHTIHMVYQSSFINVDKTTGFGDFIRGCLYVVEFCEKHKIACQFHIKNHHLKKYLKYFEHKPEISNDISNGIHKYLGLNAYFTCNHSKIEYHLLQNKEDSFISYVNACASYNGNIFINTTNFPLHFIAESNRSRIHALLEPTDEFHTKIEQHMMELNLVKHQFITYHIRLGDNYLNDPVNHTQINTTLIQSLVDKMNINPDYVYFLISDTPFIKKIMISKFPNLKCIFFEISHTCENDAYTLQNTLIEFYIMSYSKAILSMSIYPHGSGFSKWCSVLYKIPYVCYLLPKLVYY